MQSSYINNIIRKEPVKASPMGITGANSEFNKRMSEFNKKSLLTKAMPGLFSQ